MGRATPYVIAWFAALAAFAVMTGFASVHDMFPGDLWLTERLQDVNSGAVADVLRWGSRMVEWPYWGIVALAGALYALRAAGLRIAPLIVLAFFTRYLNNVLKDVADRPRPSPEDVEVDRVLSTLSFPSGHAYNAAVLYGLIFFLAALYVPSSWARTVVQGLCILIIAGTGLDRVYLGYHWPSDILGGYLSAVLVLAPLVAIGLWLTGRWPKSRPEPAS